MRASPRRFLLQQWIADHGFIVVSIDGRGTPARGRDWERVIKNNLIYAPKSGAVSLTTGAAQATSGGALVGDPLFTNVATLDLSLKANSPGVGKGVAAPVSDDYASNRRHSGGPRDIGAYQR